MTEELSFEQKSTLWIGGISDQVDEEILYELFQNAGPLTSVKIPVDKETKRQKNFAFIHFAHEESVPYAAELFQDVKLFGRFLRMQNKDTGVGMPKNDNRYQQQRSYNGDDRRRNDRDQERRDRDRNSRESNRGNSRDQERNDREQDNRNNGMANHHRSMSAPQMMNNGQFNFTQDGPFQMPVSPMMMNQQQQQMNPFQMQMFQQQQMMQLMQQQQQNGGGGFNSYQNQPHDRRNRDDHRNNRRSDRYDDRNRDRSRSDDRRDRSYDRRSNNRR